MTIVRVWVPWITRRWLKPFDAHCFYTVSQKKTVPLFTAYNFRNNIEQIFTKFATNQSLFILNIVPEFISINFGK